MTKLDPEIAKKIQDYYKEGLAPADIKRRLENEGIILSYSSIYGQRSDVKESRRSRAYHYSVKARERGPIYQNLTSCIMEVFESYVMTANDIRVNLEARFGVELPKALEKRIDKAIKNLEDEYGDNSPIIHFGEREYKLNRKSPYWVMCDGFAGKNEEE